MRKVTSDAMVEMAEKLRMQKPLLSEDDKFSISKLAEVVVKNNNLVRYKSLTWKKIGYTLVPLASDELGQMA